MGLSLRGGHPDAEMHGSSTVVEDCVVICIVVTDDAPVAVRIGSFEIAEMEDGSDTCDPALLRATLSPSIIGRHANKEFASKFSRLRVACAGNRMNDESFPVASRYNLVRQSLLRCLRIGVWPVSLEPVWMSVRR